MTVHGSAPRPLNFLRHRIVEHTAHHLAVTVRRTARVSHIHAAALQTLRKIAKYRTSAKLHGLKRAE